MSRRGMDEAEARAALAETGAEAIHVQLLALAARGGPELAHGVALALLEAELQQLHWTPGEGTRFLAAALAVPGAPPGLLMGGIAFLALYFDELTDALAGLRQRLLADDVDAVSRQVAQADLERLVAGLVGPRITLGGQGIVRDETGSIAASVAAFNAARGTRRPDLPDALNTEVLSIEEVQAFLEALERQSLGLLDRMIGEQALELSARGLRLFYADGLGLGGLAERLVLRPGAAGWRLEPGVFAPDLLADLEAGFALRRERQAAARDARDEAAYLAARRGVAVVERAVLGLVRLAGFSLKNGHIPEEAPLTLAQVAAWEGELSTALRDAPATGRGWSPPAPPAPPSPEDVAALGILVRETLGLAPTEPLDPRAPLHAELGLTSMDLLDLIFRVEEHFGVVIPRGSAAALVRGPVAESAFAEDGLLTPLGRSRLAAFLGQPVDALPAEIELASLPQHFTVEALARLVAQVRGRA
ncbi:MAG: acyl carrier protein [Myxococcales bacterium]|nr:acyl carrier protein [Myxococcales bacterium]